MQTWSVTLVWLTHTNSITTFHLEKLAERTLWRKPALTSHNEIHRLIQRLISISPQRRCWVSLLRRQWNDVRSPESNMRGAFIYNVYLSGGERKKNFRYQKHEEAAVRDVTEVRPSPWHQGIMGKRRGYKQRGQLKLLQTSLDATVSRSSTVNQLSFLPGHTDYRDPVLFCFVLSFVVWSLSLYSHCT